MKVERHKLNADWYRLVYTRAALRLNTVLKSTYENPDRGRAPSPEGQAEVQRAEEEAKRLLLAAGELLGASGGRLPQTATHGGGRHPRRRAFTRRVRRVDQSHVVARSRFLRDTLVPSAAVLLAGALDAGGGEQTTSDAKAVASEPEERRGRSADRLESIDVPQPPHVNSATAGELIAYVERLDRVPYRARYNLACFHTQRNELAAAARQLHSSIDQAPLRDQRRLAVQTRNDYSLRPLLTDEVVGPELATRLKRIVGVPRDQTDDPASV